VNVEESALGQPRLLGIWGTTPNTTTSSQIVQHHSAPFLPAPPASRQGPPPATIGVSGGGLELDGQPYKFVGLNAYEIGTDWGVNAGCGGMETQSQLDQLFSSLPANSLVRFWAWQGSMAINVHTQQLDWAPLDRVFSTAAEYHQHLIVVLAGQSGSCDDGYWKDPAWYDGGFMNVHDSTGLTPLSYWDYLQAVVNRYKSSPALGMWEPVSEPEASTCPPQYQQGDCDGHQTCPDEAVAEAAMRYFFDVVGGEIHALDPDHLVESGTLGSGQCGTSGSDYETVSASPGIDVLSYHDYYENATIGGDQWNGIALRLSQAASLGKPVIAGEMGIMGGTSPGCLSLSARASQISARIRAQLSAGSSGILLWDWVPSPTSTCNYDIFPGDPLMAVVGQGVAGY
jgi:hypothetical protein